MAGDDFQLTVGSKYLVKSVLTREQVQETEGVFKGISTIGTNDSILMEVAKGPHQGKLRLIPTHMIVSLDVLEAAARQEKAKKRSGEENVQYG